MTVTEQQARALTFLAVAARPIGAPRWDEAGVFANIMKCSTRSLSTVAIAVMRAAEDRNCVSPGVIPTNGPHWRTREASPEAAELNYYDPAVCCDICTVRRDRHRVPSEDHEFVSALDHMRNREPLNTKATVAALKGFIEPTAAPPEPKPLVPLEERDPAAVAARAEIAIEETA